jgi:hypothetical protein
VTSNFDTLTHVPVKGLKVKVRISGKGYVTLVTSSKGTITVKAPITKVVSASILSQSVAGQKYASRTVKR